MTCEVILDPVRKFVRQHLGVVLPAAVRSLISVCSWTFAESAASISSSWRRAPRSRAWLIACLVS